MPISRGLKREKKTPTEYTDFVDYLNINKVQSFTRKDVEVAGK